MMEPLCPDVLAEYDMYQEILNARRGKCARVSQHLHIHVILQLHEPDASECDFCNAEEQGHDDNHGAIESKARGFRPAWVACPGEVMKL